MISQTEFNLALTVVSHAIPETKETMPALQSMLLEFTSDREMRMIGTNGEVIVVCCLELNHMVPVGSTFQINKSDVTKMIDELPCDVSGIRYPLCTNVTICIFGDTFMATTENGCVTAERAALPEYPEYRKVMVNKRCLPGARSFELNYLADALIALSPFCDLVNVDINGLAGPGYIDAMIPEGAFERIKSIRIGVASFTGGSK